ncbi:MAG: phosphonopyruvate decarboxylase [Deltaproteobacteria bacterium]|nr:phosphonopyruvate decarboxylase [Deltaproteobacteria bacterium]
MIKCSTFYEMLITRGISFFTGVPDSLLKDFCAYITDHVPDNQHVIAANEGGAVALAAGHYLATGHIGLVYMQNSGQGNAVNPLTSLADPDVYGIPILLLIGWRGEPGVKDEPQHAKQGKITLQILQTLDIPYRILPENVEEADLCLEDLFAEISTHKCPAALIVKKGVFDSYKLKQTAKDISLLSREYAIQKIVDSLRPTDILVSTTGMISRELYEYRDAIDGNHSSDFLTVGSMGHASQIAMGIALAKPDRQVFCLDGDGAALMHLGAMAIIGSRNLNNFKHIILNNAAHDSVGGQPTAGKDVAFTKIAIACGYKSTLVVESQEELRDLLPPLLATQGPALLEIRVRKGARADLGRPKTTPHENKAAFMEFLSK